jgi:asparagine synthase (glutamine-hydrolysing)
MIGTSANTGARVEQLVKQMTATLSHRGPDGAGLFSAHILGSDRSIALGHRRLAVLDLSDAGRQPMSTRDGRWTLVLNGEIFNYVELRTQLVCQRSLAFHSTTDTEVLLEACAAWGVAATLERAVGMFAFALWDSVEGELTLARDRVGEKPLVYFWDRNTLAFASEMKALRPLHSGRLSAPAVDVYLGLGYVPAPLGIFLDTAKLPAGYLARWKNGSLDVRRWWFPEHAPPEPGNGSRAAQLRERVADAVGLRLRSDVPVALALSGGLDSSVIAAELSRQGSKPDAFTVDFEEDSTDLPYARQVAVRHGLRLEVIRAEGQGVAEEFAAAARHYDEPFADSSGLASLALARALDGRYKVILNGDGGDEAFGGYRHYEYVGPKQMIKAAAAAAGFRDGSGPVDVYVQSKTTFRRHERAGLVGSYRTGDPLTTLLATDEFLRVEVPGALKQALWSDRHLYLANDLTYKMDIALGAYGVEGRAPFLDHRLLEWAQQLDSRELVRGREKKVLLRQAYQDQLPRAVVSRAKHGFGAPIAQWLAGPLASRVRAALPCPLLDDQAQAAASGQRLWTLLTFAEWARTWSAKW